MAARWAALLLLVPMMILGGLSGAALLLHAHDGHFLHLHVGVTQGEATVAAAEHVAAHDADGCLESRHGQPGHRHGRPCSDHTPAPAETPADDPGHDHTDPGQPGGLLVEVPDFESGLSRKVGLGLVPSLVATLATLTWHAVPAWGAPPPVLVAGPAEAVAPIDCVPLRARERLVRTSLALLI